VEFRIQRADSPGIPLPGLVRQLGTGEGCVFCAARAFSSGLRGRLAELGACVCGWPAAGVPSGLREFMEAVSDILTCEPGETKCWACLAARRDAVACPAHALCATHRLTA
jgi:hypothetical protein